MCLSASVADFVVVLGDGCGACSAQPLRLFTAGKLGKRSTLIRKIKVAFTHPVCKSLTVSAKVIPVIPNYKDHLLLFHNVSSNYYVVYNEPVTCVKMLRSHIVYET